MSDLKEALFELLKAAAESMGKKLPSHGWAQEFTKEIYTLRGSDAPFDIAADVIADFYNLGMPPAIAAKIYFDTYPDGYFSWHNAFKKAVRARVPDITDEQYPPPSVDETITMFKEQPDPELAAIMYLNKKTMPPTTFPAGNSVH